VCRVKATNRLVRLNLSSMANVRTSSYWNKGSAYRALLLQAGCELLNAMMNLRAMIGHVEPWISVRPNVRPGAL
jgi:hypothetical protein